MERLKGPAGNTTAHVPQFRARFRRSSVSRCTTLYSADGFTSVQGPATSTIIVYSQCTCQTCTPLLQHVQRSLAPSL
jgi:hypothetical protein